VNDPEIRRLDLDARYCEDQARRLMARPITRPAGRRYAAYARDLRRRIRELKERGPDAA